jgi:hypothetical protein
MQARALELIEQIGPNPEESTSIACSWWLGFVDTVTFDSMKFGSIGLASLLSVLDHSSCRLVRVLRLYLCGGADLSTLRPQPTVRELEIEDWEHRGSFLDASALWPLYPKLDRVRFNCDHVRVGFGFELLELRCLQIDATIDDLATLASARFPAIEQLSIGLPERLDDLGSLLASLERAPRLHTLGLMDVRSVPSLCRELSAQPRLLARLRELDLRSQPSQRRTRADTDAVAHVRATHPHLKVTPRSWWDVR